MSIKIGFFHQQSMLYLNPQTGLFEGPLKRLFSSMVSLFAGNNFTLIELKDEELNCLKGKCKRALRLMQKGAIDLMCFPVDINNFDAVYPNITSTQITDENNCALITKYNPRDEIHEQDCIVSLFTFKLSVVLLALSLVLVTTIITTKLAKLTIDSITESLFNAFSLLVLQFQTKSSNLQHQIISSLTSLVIAQLVWLYSSNFQTDLASPLFVKPPDTLDDLIQNNYTAYAHFTSPCLKIPALLGQSVNVKLITKFTEMMKSVDSELGPKSLIVIGFYGDRALFKLTNPSANIYESKHVIFSSSIVYPYYSASPSWLVNHLKFRAHHLLHSNLIPITLYRSFELEKDNSDERETDEPIKAKSFKLNNYKITFALLIGLLGSSCCIFFIKC